MSQLYFLYLVFPMMSWRAVVISEEFISCRQANGLQETWIYALCRDNNRRNCCFAFDPDPSRRSWKSLPILPSCCLKRDGMAFESLGRKLYLLGGCSWNQDAIDEVFCFDASLNKWEGASPMPRARCYLVTATVGGILYAMDGEVMNSVDFSCWDTYNQVLNMWTTGSKQKVDPYIKKAIVVEDHKIYTIHSKQPDIHYAIVHDEVSNTWNYASKDGIEHCWRGPTVVVDKELYMLDEGLGMKLTRFRDGFWMPVGRLSLSVTGPQCQLAAIGRKVFVVGKGLRTVVVDVDAAVDGGRMLVSSPPIPSLDPDLSVVSCKTVTL